MSMKLLSQTEVKDIRAQDQARDIMRIQEIKEALNSANKMFAKAQTDFNDMLARNRGAWAQEEKDHTQRVHEMNEEIRALEAKRAKALEPVTELHLAGDLKMKTATEITAKNEAWTATLADMEERLEEKLSEVGEREVDVAKRENQVTIKEQGNEVETNVIKMAMEALKGEQDDFSAYKTQAELGIIGKQNDINNKELDLISREEAVKQEWEKIRTEKVQIADARGMIEREVKRLNIPV